MSRETKLDGSIRPISALPPSLAPRGLSRVQAAAYIGVGPTKFDELVRSGIMPRPRKIGARRLWDKPEIDVAFAELPRVGDEPESNPWDEVGP